MSEVHDMLNDFSSSSSSLRESLLSLRNNTRNVSNLESFSGAGASATKGYLKDVHVEVSVAYQDIIDDMKDKLKTSVTTFHSKVDSDQSCIIKSDYVTDFENKVKTSKDTIKKSVKAINTATSSINDISSVSKISTDEMTSDYDQIKKITTDLLKNFSEYSSTEASMLIGLEDGISKLNSTQNEMNKISSSSSGVGGYAPNKSKNLLSYLREAKKINRDSKRLYKASKNIYFGYVLKMSKGSNKYKYYLSNSKYAKFFGVKLLKDLPPGKNRVLQYNAGYITKEGKNLFKSLGFIDGDPKFLLNYKGGKAKALGKAAKDGAKNSFKIFDFKGFKGLSKTGKVLKGAGTGLTVLSAGLSAYDNYNDAKVQGLSKKQSVLSSALGTAGDLAVGGASAQVGMAIGTAIGGPVGLVIGLGLGIGIGKAGSYVLSGVKKGMNYVIKNGVSKSINDAGKVMSNTANKAIKGVSDRVNSALGGLKSVGKWAFD